MGIVKEIKPPCDCTAKLPSVRLFEVGTTWTCDTCGVGWAVVNQYGDGTMEQRHVTPVKKWQQMRGPAPGPTSPAPDPTAPGPKRHVKAFCGCGNKLPPLPAKLDNANPQFESSALSWTCSSCGALYGVAESFVHGTLSWLRIEDGPPPAPPVVTPVPDDVTAARAQFETWPPRAGEIVNPGGMGKGPKERAIELCDAFAASAELSAQLYPLCDGATTTAALKWLRECLGWTHLEALTDMTADEFYTAREYCQTWGTRPDRAFVKDGGNVQDPQRLTPIRDEALMADAARLGRPVSCPMCNCVGSPGAVIVYEDGTCNECREREDKKAAQGPQFTMRTGDKPRSAELSTAPGGVPGPGLEPEPEPEPEPAQPERRKTTRRRWSKTEKQLLRLAERQITALEVIAGRLAEIADTLANRD